MSGVGTQWIDELLADLPDHPAVRNAFFERFKSAPLSHEQLIRFGSQYHRWVDAFPKILAGLVYNVDDDESRIQLTRILLSELGDGHPAMLHSRLLMNVFESVGVPRSDLVAYQALPETQILISGLRSLYHDCPVAEALGAQLALEAMAYSMIEQLHVGFRHYRSMSDPDLEYFRVHLVVEGDHILWAKAAVGCRVHSVADSQEAQNGYRQCLELIGCFWRRLAREVKALEPEGVERQYTSRVSCD